MSDLLQTMTVLLEQKKQDSDQKQEKKPKAKEEKPKEKPNKDRELISGKKEKILINPQIIEEGVANAKNQAIRQIGASPKREKQWVKYKDGLVEVFVFSESPKTHYIRLTAKNLSDEDSQAALVEMQGKVRSWANKEGIPLIKAAPRIPDSVLGKIHVAMGSYSQRSKTLTFEVSQPKGK